MKNILFSSLLIFLYSCAAKGPQQQAALPSAEILTIDTAQATTQREYTAALEGKVNVEIRPQIDGPLEKVYVDEGAYVHAGQPLFKINEQPFREQLNNATANLHAAEAAASNAQLEIDKLTPLVQNKVVSDIQLKTAKAAHRAAVANAEQAKAMVASARINMDYTLIKAPVSGYIGRLPKKQGSLVSRMDAVPLTQLSDVQEVYAYFSLSETDFINFKAQYPGATLSEKLKQLPGVTLVLADNTTYPQTGKIDMVDGQFDRNTGAITLRATFPNGEGLLRSGNTGKIRLSIAHASAILVPQAATIDIQDKTFVYVLNDSNKVSKQPISIAGKSGTDYLVRDGLKAGTRVVFSGLEHLQEGMMVKPEPVKAEAKQNTAGR
jgi:membrane fusion protein (multidrug efflux system)